MSDEDLIRIEFKLDLLIAGLQFAGVLIPTASMPQLRDIERDVCPVCGEGILITLDLKNEQVRRVCGCKLSKQIVPGISKLTQPPEVNDGYRAREAEVAVPPEPEEGGAGHGGRAPAAGPGDRQQG